MGEKRCTATFTTAVQRRFRSIELFDFLAGRAGEAECTDALFGKRVNRSIGSSARFERPCKEAIRFAPRSYEGPIVAQNIAMPDAENLRQSNLSADRSRPVAICTQIRLAWTGRAGSGSGAATSGSASSSRGISIAVMSTASRCRSDLGSYLAMPSGRRMRRKRRPWAAEQAFLRRLAWPLCSSQPLPVSDPDRNPGPESLSRKVATVTGADALAACEGAIST